MRYTLILLLLSTISLGVHAQNLPQPKAKTEFTDRALQQIVYTQTGDTLSLKTIFKQNLGKTLVVDIWASWCMDCLKSIPKVKELQAKNPSVEFINLSLDKKQEPWKKAIEKHQLLGQHYWFNTAWKNDFTDYIDLNWIPRYMIINKKGGIALYYATEPTDPKIQALLDEQNNHP